MLLTQNYLLLNVLLNVFLFVFNFRLLIFGGWSLIDNSRLFLMVASSTRAAMNTSCSSTVEIAITQSICSDIGLVLVVATTISAALGSSLVFICLVIVI